MLTTEQILDTAEDVLRRYGPRKTTVVDVARALNISHGTVYRHFKTKAELHEAITARWVERVTLPLGEISKRKTAPKERLREWFETLVAIKQAKAKDDPEMFASYTLLAQSMPKHIKFKHINLLISQIESILIDGNNDGSFQVDDCAATARSLFFGTALFHHPLHVNHWNEKHVQEDFNQLFSLLEKAIQKR